MDSERTIAVLLPGIGYNFDRPLLHFGREQALQYGYEVKLVPYTGFPQHVRGDQGKMAEALQTASSQTEDILSDVQWDAYAHIVFLSKSIGTVVATHYAAEHHLAADQILFTPFPETFEVPASGRALAFHAASDPWMDNEKVIAAAKAAGVPMEVFPEGNHSLETGNAVQDIWILEEVFRKTETIFADRT